MAKEKPASLAGNAGFPFLDAAVRGADDDGRRMQQAAAMAVL
jgi:hypothetical protein